MADCLGGGQVLSAGTASRKLLLQALQLPEALNRTAAATVYDVLQVKGTAFRSCFHRLSSLKDSAFPCGAAALRGAGPAAARVLALLDLPALAVRPRPAELGAGEGAAFRLRFHRLCSRRPCLAWRRVRFRCHPAKD